MPTRYLTTREGRTIADPRGTQAWRRMAKQAAVDEPLCWLGLQGCTLISTTGDHVIPVVDAPDLALVRSNVRGACRPCNEKRGNLAVHELRLGGNSSGSALDIFE